MDTRLSPYDVEFRELIDRALSRLNTAIPGKITSFDPSTQTAQVSPSIKMKQNIDGVQTFVDLPELINVPVVFPFAVSQGFCLTLPISSGDPCLLIFSQRAIDNWHERGGVQPSESGIGSRHHDLTDAFALMAPVPLPNVLADWETNGIELRNTAKTSRVTVKDNTIEIVCGTFTMTINSNGSFSITAPTSGVITSVLTQIVGALSVSNGLSVGAGGASITGSISSSVDVSDSKGSMDEMRGVFNSHTHNETGSVTQTPNQSMS